MRSLSAAIAAGLAIAWAAGASAQDFKPFKLNVIGNVANIPQSNEIEIPVFNGLKQKSGGKIDVRFRTFQELGMKGEELTRLPPPGGAATVAPLLGSATRA